MFHLVFIFPLIKKIVIELEFLEEYNLTYTFDCGQIFRFESFDNGKTYYGPLEDRIIKITQRDPHTLVIESTKEKDLQSIIKKFFRVGDNYLEMQTSIRIDSIMDTVVQATNGLHMLRQDLFECFIAYLLSQCSNIPRITKNLNELAKRYGIPIKMDGHEFYLFPKREDLLDLSVDHFKDMGFGYRAKYIHSFLHNYPEFIFQNQYNGLELNKKLQEIDGIGQKVADCIQLFGFGDLTIFPVDTWIHKYMIKYYFNGNSKTSLKQIRQTGMRLFGKWSGYAEELIYMYSRCLDPNL